MNRTRVFLSTIIYLFLSSFGFGQVYSPSVEDKILMTDLSSLTSFVRILSGEDSVTINGSNELITHRVNSRGNDLAANYIRQTLDGFGLETTDQRYSFSGRNIYAVQEGTVFPDAYYIICAHYDAVADYCADDNASGTAAVLEAARILSNYEFEYSIVYALWDEEETGLDGSHAYAQEADAAEMDIRGVLNIDMAAWDGDNDGLFDIHTRTIGNSDSLASIIVGIDRIYKLPLTPVIYNPGTTRSDHGSFWNFDYSSVLIIEAFYGDDFNPFYHSSSDRIDKFNLFYFHNMVKLGVGTLATLAKEVQPVSVEEENDKQYSTELSNYPNPFNNTTMIRYTLPDDAFISIELFNTLGEKIETIHSGYIKAGVHDFKYENSSLSSGMYYIVLHAGNSRVTRKITLLK